MGELTSSFSIIFSENIDNQTFEAVVDDAIPFHLLRQVSFLLLKVFSFIL